METITEILRLPSPAPQPQSLAADGGTLWMGSRAMRRVYAIDRASWVAHEDGALSGVPWGIAVVGDELRIVHGEDPDDDRYVRRYVPGHGLTTDGGFRAPDGTGSQLGWDGDVLYLSQWYRKRVLGLDANGTVLSTIDVPHQICGQVVAGGCFYLVTTDDEDPGPYWLTRVDARGAEPVCEDLAIIPFAARALAFDGEHFWTNHREADEIVAFSLAGSPSPEAATSP